MAISRAPMNRFPPSLGSGCFSSCSTDTWYPKHWNPKKFFVMSLLLYSITQNEFWLFLHTKIAFYSNYHLYKFLDCVFDIAVMLVNYCEANSLIHILVLCKFKICANAWLLFHARSIQKVIIVYNSIHHCMGYCYCVCAVEVMNGY